MYAWLKVRRMVKLRPALATTPADEARAALQALRRVTGATNRQLAAMLSRCPALLKLNEVSEVSSVACGVWFRGACMV